jgi:hypothetical protein
MRILNGSWGPGPERRKRQRVSVCWTVSLLRENAQRPIQSRTANLSSDGFYCLVSIPLTVGEKIWCDIVIPSPVTTGISLHCRATVLRVESTVGESVYGVACRMEDYTVVRRADSLGEVSPKVNMKTM